MASLRSLKKSMKNLESKKKKKKKKREGSGEGCRRESSPMDDAGDEMIPGEESLFAQAPKAKMRSPKDFEMEMDRAPGGSRERCGRESSRVDDGGAEMIRGEESVFAQAPKVKMPSPEDLERDMDREDLERDMDREDFERYMDWKYLWEDLEREMDQASGGSDPVNVDGNGGAGGVTSANVMLEEATGVHAQKNKRKASSSLEEKDGANKGKKVKMVTEVEGKTVEKDIELESMGGASEGGSSIGAGPIELDERGEDLAARRQKKRQRDNKKSRGLGSNGYGSPAGTGVATIGPRIAVVVTPHMPRRYGYLLKIVSFLLPYKSSGKAYQCSSPRIETLLRHTRCNLSLFFEWEPNDKKTICWMFNSLTRTRVRFLVNPAFTSEELEVKVKRAACSFSSNFAGDETWNVVKETLEMMFCPAQHEQSEEPDHIYFFTRIDDCVYFRNMKVGPYFCLKLIDVQREGAVSCRASDISQSQMTTELSLCPTMCYSLSPGLGPCSLHSLCLNGQEFLIVLENGLDLSVFEGFNLSLLEFLDEEPFLKKKKIVGSKDDEEYNFVRNIGKMIIRSILAHLLELFSSNKCVELAAKTLVSTKILLKGSSVKFFGVELVEYEKGQANDNIHHVVKLIKSCFPANLIPCDLMDVFDRLLEDLEDPLESLKLAKDDPSLLLAKERRELMIHLHTEYMTNVKPKLLIGDNAKVNCNSFFENCPYLHSWINTMGKNKYLGAVANYNSDFVTMRVQKRTVEEGNEAQMGEFQFAIMRNCDVHIPENVLKDGITPFRLSWTDYIRTSYFRRYLSFIQKRMARYKS
ncbi:hypothetical protein EJB05_42266 [Eragrostis curvula]|uniref:Uncharacterized protein n=1 Tax=Eragrostis curvula TaxID=38414 RepID=A0A5J9TBT3_9POAL|nr:hypothetical protein EJB05_42266 [Eragrostis curvula]